MSIQEEPVPSVPAAADGFEVWIGERSRWLQTAAKMLIETKRNPSEDELLELVRLCKLEAAKNGDPGFGVVVPGSLALASHRPPIRIEGITDVHGLNAVKLGANLPFSEGQLTVFYGQNGSGKSGFARLLKQACGSKSKDDIHPNVFEEITAPCSATFHLTFDGVARKIDWTLEAGAHAKMRHAQVFDSKTATLYMGKNEASYEPSQMKFVTALINISDQVSQRLVIAKNALVSALPMFPQELADTEQKRWFDGLRFSTTLPAIDKATLYDKSMDEERITLEGLLAQKDAGARVAAIELENQAIANVRTAMNALKAKLTDAVTQAMLAARSEAATKRKAAQESALSVFADGTLEGVGELTWQKLWEQARLYSESQAYPDHKFPVVVDDAKCVLCQQELSVDAAARLSKFEKFVSEGLERSAKTAEAALTELSMALPLAPTEQDWLAHMSVLKVDQATALEWLKRLAKRRVDLDTADHADQVGAFDWLPIDEALSKIYKTLTDESTALTELLQDGKRQEMDAKVRALKAIQWLQQNKAAILSERHRLAAVDHLGKASKLAATNSLTAKNNELAKSELDAGYQARFTDELKRLGGSRLPVIPQSKPAGKGRTTFGLALVGAHGNRAPEQILSEGETRIVALAAFLADITGSNQIAPFIFDDPISSLDQDFEERVVARLIELARTRQVIIFTHRLSLVALLDAGIKKGNDNPSLGNIVHHVQTLRRLDKTSGILAGQSAKDAKPRNALNKLLGESLVQLRKHQTNGDADSYDLMAKSVCSDFRIVVERTVEMILINGVVQRFRREITTRNVLRKLAHITNEDCDLIDDLMTRYSVFEHSQADELPSIPPELNELETDMKSLSEWMTQFQDRAA